MSLSKNLRDTTEKKKSWQKYEMESFETFRAQKQNNKNDFVTLEIATDQKQTFVPLDALENSGDQREIGNDTKKSEEYIAGIEQEAYEKGFAQGEKDGLELGEKKAAKFLENIEKLFDEMSNLKHEILKKYEREILDLIFAVAEKIIHHEVRSGDAVIRNSISNALELAVEKSKVILNVNPEDYDYIEKLRPEIFSQNKELKSIVVNSDPAVTKGGCFLETPYGNIDATIESKLDKIYQCLRESVE